MVNSFVWEVGFVRILAVLTGDSAARIVRLIADIYKMDLDLRF
jgi:hypothetical protein